MPFAEELFTAEEAILISRGIREAEQKRELARLKCVRRTKEVFGEEDTYRLLNLLFVVIFVCLFCPIVVVSKTAAP